MKRLLALALLLVCATTVFAQRRTTSVRGYYRKDGTYVRPHTRSYQSGSSSSSGSSYTPSSNYTPNNFYSWDNNIQVDSSELRVSADRDVAKNGAASVSSPVGQGFPVYLAVMRYRDTLILDATPFGRDLSNYEYNLKQGVYCKFSRFLLKDDEVLDLIGKYGFELNGNFVTKSFYLGLSQPKLPHYLSLKVEMLTLR